MRKSINKLLSITGRRIVSWPIAKGVIADSHIVDLLARHTVNVLLDVGGHLGETGRKLRGLGFSGRIASFEPVAASFLSLKKHADADGDWRAFKTAIGDVEGKATIHEAVGTSLSSLHQASAFGRSHFGENLNTSDSEVDVTRLDAIFGAATEGIADPKVFLKIDTQGHELAVLAGAPNSLWSVRILQMEAAVRPVYDNAPTFMEIYAAAVAAGFALTSFVPGSRDNSLALNEMDAFFVRVANPKTA